MIPTAHYKQGHDYSPYYKEKLCKFKLDKLTKEAFQTIRGINVDLIF